MYRRSSVPSRFAAMSTVSVCPVVSASVSTHGGRERERDSLAGETCDDLAMILPSDHASHASLDSFFTLASPVFFLTMTQASFTI